jgi:REP-associated tyrosine transposase
MPANLTRYHNTGNFHFITFSCYKRSPLLAQREGYSTFEHQLETVRQRHKFVIAGYVLMPEHVHLLISEPQIGTVAVTLQVLKQGTSRHLKQSGELQFWQRRYYDFNVWSEKKTEEKLSYMHHNPVRRGLVTRPEDWKWSSFRHHATGVIGTVEIESEWTARRRERHNNCNETYPAHP